MARSPKQTPQRKDDAGPPPIRPPTKEVKPILKDSMKIAARPPVSPIKSAPKPTPAAKPKPSPIKPVCAKPTAKPTTKPACADIEEDYERVFIDLVGTLPKIDQVSQDPDKRYTVEEFQEDIVCIIADIYETCGYLVVPDQEMLMDLAKTKIDGKSLQTLFVYGNETIKSCHEKIKEYTLQVRKREWDGMCDRFSKMDTGINDDDL